MSCDGTGTRCPVRGAFVADTCRWMWQGKGPWKQIDASGTCSPSAPAECQDLAGSYRFGLQEFIHHRIRRGAAVLRDGCVPAGIAALRL